MKENEKNKIFIACDEANHYCDKTQYKEATLWEKVVLNIHLMYCRACRQYTKSNSKLTKLIHNPKVHAMHLDEKDALKERLKRELSK